MTIDFTNDQQLGELLRTEVPARGAEYWSDIATTLGTSIDPDGFADTGRVDAGQPIDVDPAANAITFGARLRRGAGGTAALLTAAAILIIVGVLVGTRVQRSNERVNVGFAQDPSAVVSDPAELETWPGPRPNRDHWHAVYGVWDCTANQGQGDWLPAFDSTQDDTGIHSHGDGMIYIHPFFEESAGRNATFSHFISEMQLALTDSSLTTQNGSLLLEGTLCDGQKSVLHLRRWQLDRTARTETVLSPRIITENLNDERFYNDREVWILALAPLDAEIPLPPAERFAALDNWSLPGDFSPPPTIGASTMQSLEADVARVLDPPFEEITYLPSNEPTTAFGELTRDGIPDWADSIVEASFRPIASATHRPDPRQELVAYRIAVADGTTRSCTSMFDVAAQQMSSAAFCNPADGSRELSVDARPSSVLVRNTPANSDYVVIETTSGQRIITNVVERHSYVGWDFSQDPISEVSFYNAALRNIGSCLFPTTEADLPCTAVLDN